MKQYGKRYIRSKWVDNGCPCCGWDNVDNKGKTRQKLKGDTEEGFLEFEDLVNEELSKKYSKQQIKQMRKYLFED